MIALVASVFVAALLGSAHCAAMCGGLACFASGRDGGRGTIVTYNAARGATYLLLGAMAGFAGAGFDAAGSLVGVQRPAAIIAGSLMVLWGLGTALSALGVRLPALAMPAAATQMLSRSTRALRNQPPIVRAATLGALTPLLPCGWLYAFVATAAAAGSTLSGALVMLAFWLGTVPAMAAVGAGAQRLLGPAARRLPAITATALVVIGALTIAGKFGAPPHLHASTPSQPRNTEIVHDHLR
jgi:sulfite exporter TauE/SafE